MADNEPRQYAKQFVDFFESLGVDPVKRETGLTNPIAVGLMVGIPDPENPSEAAKKFMKALKNANLSARYTRWMSLDKETLDFDLFVGPAPW
jgi:hypothetical protein